MRSCPQHRQGDEARNAGQQIAFKAGPHELPDHFGNPFAALEGHVADEPVGYDDVRIARIDTVSFHIADVVQRTGRKEFVRLLDLLVALDFLLADVQQANAGAIHTLHCGHFLDAHHGELEKILGGTVHVGAQVQDPGLTRQRWQGGDDRRPVHVGQHLEDETGRGHQRARVAGADAGLGLARLHQVDGHPHGGVFLVPQRLAREFVHADLLAGVVHTQARRVEAGIHQMLPYDVFAAHEDQFDIGVLIDGFYSRRNDDGGAEVAPHHVQGYTDPPGHPRGQVLSLLTTLRPR